jgi:hypothetical protein
MNQPVTVLVGRMAYQFSSMAQALTWISESAESGHPLNLRIIPATVRVS